MKRLSKNPVGRPPKQDYENRQINAKVESIKIKIREAIEAKWNEQTDIPSKESSHKNIPKGFYVKINVDDILSIKIKQKKSKTTAKPEESLKKGKPKKLTKNKNSVHYQRQLKRNMREHYGDNHPWARIQGSNVFATRWMSQPIFDGNGPYRQVRLTQIHSDLDLVVRGVRKAFTDRDKKEWDKALYGRFLRSTPHLRRLLGKEDDEGKKSPELFRTAKQPYHCDSTTCYNLACDKPITFKDMEFSIFIGMEDNTALWIADWNQDEMKIENEERVSYSPFEILVVTGNKAHAGIECENVVYEVVPPDPLKEEYHYRFFIAAGISAISRVQGWFVDGKKGCQARDLTKEQNSLIILDDDKFTGHRHLRRNKKLKTQHSNA